MEPDSLLDAFEIRFYLWCWTGLKYGARPQRRNIPRDARGILSNHLEILEKTRLVGGDENPGFNLGISLSEVPAYFSMTRDKILGLIFALYTNSMVNRKVLREFYTVLDINISKGNAANFLGQEIEAYGFKQEKAKFYPRTSK